MHPRRFNIQGGVLVCIRAWIAAVAAFGLASAANAAVFTYQGVLKSAGAPLNGAVDLKFRLYANSAGAGIPLGNLAINGVAVADGLLKVDLDFGPSAFNGADRWLEIDVASPAAGGVGPFTTLTPRQQIGYAPMAQYALNATLSGTYANAVSFTSASNAFTGSAAGLTNLNPGSISSGTISNALTLSSASNVFNGSGAGLTNLSATNIATGTLNAARLPVPLTLAGTNSAHIVRGENTATSGGAAGVFGFTSAATGNTYGVFGQTASTTGRGVFGYATSASGAAYGGQFLSDSTSGRGVHGWAANPSGITYGVYGESASTSGRGVYGHATANAGSTAGGYFRSDSTTGNGVFGYASADTGFASGVFGSTSSSQGFGVYALASADAGATYGVYAETRSPDGNGVFGDATATTGYNHGVEGQSASPQGTGVFGRTTANTGTATGVIGVSESVNGFGVYGSCSANTGTNYGVYGVTDSTTGRGVNGVASANTGVSYGGRFQSDSTSGFDVYAGGAGLDYGSSSSRRWKSNIRNIDQPLDKIARLRGVYYDWDAEHGGHGDVGFIAEEMGEVLPEIVRYEENGVDAIGIDYSKVTPLLVEALNALRAEKNAEIAILHDTIAQRDVEIEALNARLAAIERRLQSLADDRR